MKRFLVAIGGFNLLTVDAPLCLYILAGLAVFGGLWRFFANRTTRQRFVPRQFKVA